MNSDFELDFTRNSTDKEQPENRKAWNLPRSVLVALVAAAPQLRSVLVALAAAAPVFGEDAHRCLSFVCWIHCRGSSTHKKRRLTRVLPPFALYICQRRYNRVWVDTDATTRTRKHWGRQGLEIDFAGLRHEWHVEPCTHVSLHAAIR